MSAARSTSADAAPGTAGTRLSTSIGFAVGLLALVVEFLVALAIGSADLALLVPIAYLVFGACAALAMGFAPSRPFQRGLTPGLAVAVLVWLTLFDQNTFDVVAYLVVTMAGWLIGLEVSRRRGRLPPELPATGRRPQGARSTRRQ